MLTRRAVPLLAAILFALNLWIAWGLVGVGFIDQMKSIEGGYIGLARFILKNWTDLSWYPLWYGGVPFHNTYPPLLHLTVAAVAKLFNLAPVVAYHSTTAVMYAAGPVTLFVLAFQLSKSGAYSFAAGMFYSLISPSAFLLGSVRGSYSGLFNARRFQMMVQSAEAPHIAAMTLLPIAILLLAVAFRKRRPLWWVLAAIACAAIALTNWLGVFAMLFAVPAWRLSRDEALAGPDWLKLIPFGAFAYALAAVWIPPSTILGVERDEMMMGGPVAARVARILSVIGLALAMVLLVWVCRRYKLPQAFRFGLLFLLPTAWLPLSAEWFQVAVVPQPTRSHLEMEMGIALVAAFGAKLILDRCGPRVRWAVGVALILLSLPAAVHYKRYARYLSRPIDICRRIEYREAQWLADNLGGERVFAPGSTGFFLNAFSDVPQFGGGYYQAVLDPVQFHFTYQLTTGMNAGAREGEIAEIGLRAFGVGAVVVSGPRSEEMFKDFRNPKKFDGILPELWRQGDDVIYRVPRRSTSLAHVMRRVDLPSRVPQNGMDLEPLRPFVRALEDVTLPLAPMRWLNPHEAVISAQMEKDQVLSVQISAHPGWNATANGRQVEVSADSLGQVVIEPACAGPCTVALVYDGGTEGRVARFVSWGALLAGITWILADAARRGRRKRFQPQG